MSLFKQVSIILLFIFVILFTLIMGVSFNIIKDSTQKSLYENVQNSVSSISLSITNAGSDLSSIKTVINASFDNGNYERIVFKDIDENIIYDLKKDIEFDENLTPLWFKNLVEIDEISAKSIISRDWKVLGAIEIYNDRTIFYYQTYSIFKSLVISLLISFVGLLLILFFLFDYILKPLKTIKKQAIAVMRNEFIIQETLPFTSEFKSVTLSINSMITKIEKMFDNTNNVLKLNKELLYFDEVSKLHNRKYFSLKLNEYLDKDNPNNQGFIGIISLKIEDLNKNYGYVKTNNILINFANLMKEEFESNTSITARMNGSEFVLLVPNIDESMMKMSLKRFINNIHEKLEISKDEIFIGLIKYEEEQDAKTLLTKMDYVLSQAKTFHEQDYYFIEDINTCLTKEEWINTINLSLENDYFKLLYRDVIDINLENIIQKTISFELNYKDNNFSYIGLIPSLLAQGRLSEVYLHIIEKIFKKNQKENEQITIQLPIAFVVDFNNYSKLKELLLSIKNSIIKILYLR